MPAEHPTVASILMASSRARRTHALDLGFGRSAAIWRNERDRVAYVSPEGYTFSLYLEGGAGTRRLDRGGCAGWPGALSIMPHGCGSEWDITAPFAFAHLYVPASEMAQTFAALTGRDARQLALADVTFAEAPRVAAALRGLAHATMAGDALGAEAAAVEALALVLSEPRWGAIAPRRLTGGLAPHLARRVVEYVEAHLDGPLRLADLARIAGMSAFHFQRAFKASLGLSPQAFVTRRRLARAATLLASRTPLVTIALACGFSGQSHFTSAFRAATGTTPGAYRALIGRGSGRSDGPVDALRQ